MDRTPTVGAVAQLGERLVRNEEVSGSIPLGSTNPRLCHVRQPANSSARLQGCGGFTPAGAGFGRWPMVAMIRDKSAAAIMA
jgi:hypothetical protein